MKTTEPKVVVVIPNWNGTPHVFECLDALLDQVYSNVDIIVVDNNSSDGSPSEIERLHPGILLLRNQENFGFAEGCNVGIRRALADDAEYIWLVNNDAVVDREALRCLVQTAERDPTVGMLGGKVYDYEQRNLIWGVGMIVDWLYGETRPIGWNQRDAGQFSKPCEVEAISGCSLLVRRSVCERVGLMDRDYYLYAEEIDWCVRSRSNGLRCVFVPESIVFHKGGVSSGSKYNAIFSYYNSRNMLRLISKTFNFPKREVLLCSAMAFKLWKIRKDLIKVVLVKVGACKKFKYDISTLLGIIDFLLGRLGRKDQRVIMSFQNVKTH